MFFQTFPFLFACRPHTKNTCGNCQETLRPPSAISNQQAASQDSHTSSSVPQEAEDEDVAQNVQKLSCRSKRAKCCSSNNLQRQIHFMCQQKGNNTAWHMYKKINWEHLLTCSLPSDTVQQWHRTSK